MFVFKVFLLSIYIVNRGFVYTKIKLQIIKHYIRTQEAPLLIFYKA